MKFFRNKAFRNGDDGFDVEGDFHTFMNNRAEVNDGDGFKFNDNDSTGYLVKGNLAHGNEDDGFEYDGDAGTFKRNVAIDNGDDGFNMNTADNNTLIRNIAIDSHFDNFDIDGDNNTLSSLPMAKLPSMVPPRRIVSSLFLKSKPS